MSEALAKPGDMSANSRWTVDTLRDYVLGLAAANDRRFTDSVGHTLAMLTEADKRYEQGAEAQQRAIEVAFAAQQKAIDTAFTAQQTGLNAALLAQKEAIATALVAAEKAVNAALVSSAQAVQKAETAAERRFESVNEFRATLADQQRMLMPRAEVEQITKSQDAKIDLLTKAYSDQVSKSAGLSYGWTLAMGAIGLIVLIIAIIGFLRK